ncbi:hypothetical protein [Microbulbifer halophilus]|uniref:Uncharacterized protein n=1 Tax=Microbulbifer halophilus TaxID=453963 RepID=A0ABW5ECI5_9GAMM|nr:hypothetical protein [Microbulbifer halophilus]MCW8126014.1 hypothetical protein [Microbulbifer halophilus]
MASIIWTCPQCGRESHNPIDVGDYESARAIVRQLREDFDRGHCPFLCAVEGCETQLYPLRVEGFT